MTAQSTFTFSPPLAARDNAMSETIDYDYPENKKSWSGLVLVGEAPGAEEVRLGHPFVGRSGQLLDKVLERASINRKNCLVANVFRRQPPGNKVDHFFMSRRAAKENDIPLEESLGVFGSVWCRKDYAAEINHLGATLQKMAPKIIVALGRTPLWALTGENGLLEKVGKPLSCRLLPSTFVIPTYHPSFILRGNWALQDKWLEHFAKAKDYLL